MVASAWALGPKGMLVEKCTGYAFYTPFLWGKMVLCQFQVKETANPTNTQTSTPLPTTPTLSFFGLSLYASFVTVERARHINLPSVPWLFNLRNKRLPEFLVAWWNLLINKRSSILIIYYISVLTF